MTSEILVIGENLVDLLVHPDHVDAVIGGGPLNVARTLARLGASAHFLSGISADAFGIQIRHSLTTDGVQLAQPGESALPSTLAIVTMDPAGPSYHFHLQATSAFAITPPADDSPDVLYVGTLGLLVEPMASVGEQLFCEAPSSTLTVLDPNCRPSATFDPPSYFSRLQRMYQRADVVKVSVEDLDFLGGDDRVEAAHSILAAGARCVIVTDGPDPVRVLHREYELAIPVPPTDIVDTVGAGDSLTGGFIAWWTGHNFGRTELDDATLVSDGISAAIEISRRTCQQPGAQPPYAADVRELDSWRWL